MSFEKFTFRPAHQPDADNPVEFELKPIDMKTFFNLQASIGKEGQPAWEDCAAVFQNNVTAWGGLKADYSPQAKRLMLTDEGNSDLLIWLGEIAGELYKRALLRSADRKNS